MTIGRNFAAGLAGSFWPALIGLAVVPLYLKYLGIEAYGLIGFFLAMQAVMQLLDLGLSATISREVARCRAADDIATCRNFLRTFALVYWLVAFVIAIATVAAAPLIATYWLNSKAISSEIITRSVMLMGIVIAARWPSGLYLGVLTGAEQLVVANGVNIVMSTITSIGAVLILAFVSPTIEAFFVWQAVAGLGLALVMRDCSWRALGGSQGAQIRFAEVKQVWRFSIAVSAVTLSGTLFTQLDKIILSKTITLGGFGKYMLATTLAGLVYRLVSPVFTVIYPRFSAIIANSQWKELIKIYRSGSNVFAGFLFPVAMAIVISAQTAVTLWTRNPQLADEVWPIIAILAIANSLHGMMHIPYALQLAFGDARLSLNINLVLSIVVIPLIVILSLDYGAVGGALSWLILHTLYLIFGSWVTHRRLLPSVGIEWLTRDVGLPAIVTTVVGVMAWSVILALRPTPIGTLAIGTIAFCVAVAASYKASSRRIRDIVQLLGTTTDTSQPTGHSDATVDSMPGDQNLAGSLRKQL